MKLGLSQEVEMNRTSPNQKRTTAFDLSKVLLAGLAGVVGLLMVIQIPVADACQEGRTADAQPNLDGREGTPTEQLRKDQERLAASYKLLEEKLFSLHQFEQDTNPSRSKLLQRAYLQSQERMTAEEMRVVVQLLGKAKLKDAELGQKEVLAELKQLLDLLQSEDRGKRIRDEIQRHQDYLNEVERLLRMQKGIRGQTEGGVDVPRLARSQAETAERAGRLAETIIENEETPEITVQTAGPSDELESSPPVDGNRGSDPADGPGDSSGPPPPNPGESSSESEDRNLPAAQTRGENPVRKRVQNSEDRMRKAVQRLDRAERENAIEEMRQAARELALAKQELEEVLRQLREEEIERTLAMLEGRFRQMLERQVRVYDSTQKLERMALDQRRLDLDIQSSKLAVEQNEIAAAASRALMLLREDGSSVAFPATVADMYEDMQQVAGRLSATQVGRITQEIEKDIIASLEYLVSALVKTQQDMERMKQNASSGGGQPGDKPLVDQLAETKMLRGLQERIHKRHQRYAQLLDDPNDPLGITENSEIGAALDRLADRQAQLTRIARDIVTRKKPVVILFKSKRALVSGPNIGIFGLLILFGSLELNECSAARSSISSQADELAKSPSWYPPTNEAIESAFGQWLQEIGSSAEIAARVQEILDSESQSDRREFLDTVFAAMIIAEPGLGEVRQSLRDQRTNHSPPDLSHWIENPGKHVFVRNHVRLYLGRWLAQNKFYDEALAQFDGLEVASVVDPAALLFYRGLMEHQLLQRENCVATLERLLEQEKHLPRRFSVLAKMMVADIGPLKTDSLDEIARLMSDIQRRTELRRSGQIVRTQELKVIEKLDKLIEAMEAQQAQTSPGGISSSNPLDDSFNAGGEAAGDVSQKTQNDGGSWGNLPPAQRAAALAEISKDLPPHYRSVIEEYFRQLANEADR